jgi:predicted ATP-binding protein involved in virulence
LELATIDAVGTLFFVSKLLQSIQQPTVTIGILHKKVECPLFLQYFGTHRYQLTTKDNHQSLSQSILGNSTEHNPLAHLSGEYFTQTSTFQFIENSFIPLMQREQPVEDGGGSTSSFLSIKNELRPTGFIVQGETGSGKTFLLRWMAKRLNYHLMEIPSADLIHKVINCFLSFIVF